MASENPTSTEYIQHHLQNLTLGVHPDGTIGIAHGAAEAREMGFWAIHLDTMFWSIALGVLFLFFFYRAASKATSGVPGKWQNFVEMVIEFIDNNVRSTFTAKNDLVAPIALTLFVWILLMNFMDLVPVDWIPQLATLIGIPYMKVVPTTDPNATFGMSIAVFVLVIYYSIKEKGFGGFFAELAFQPFPKWLFPREPAVGKREPAREAPVPGAAIVRQPVCRRDDFYPHRHDLRWRPGVGTCRRRAAVGLGGISCSYRAVAGVHIHDPDRGVP